MNKILIIAAVVIGGIAYWYFFVRTNLSIDSVDKLNKIVRFTFNGKDYTYQYTPNEGMAAQQSGFDVSVEPFGANAVRINIYRRSKLVLNQIIDFN